MKAILDLANGFLQLLNTPIGTFATQVALLTGVLWGGTGLINAMNVLPAFFSKVTGTVSTLLPVLGLTGPQFLAIAAGIAAVIAVAPTVIDIFKQLTDKSYEAQSNLDDLNEQLTENQTRLEELNKIPIKNRTSAIQDEIEVLEEENAKLREQIELWEDKKVQADFDKIANGKTEVSGYQVRTGVGDYLDPFESDPNLQNAFVQSADEALQKLVELGVASQEAVDEAIQNASGNAIKALESLGYSLQETTRKISSQVYYEEALQGLSEDIAKFQKTGEVDADFIESYENYREILEDLSDTAMDFVESGGDISGWVEDTLEAFRELPDISDEVADSYYTVTDSLYSLSNGLEINDLQANQLLRTYPDLSSVLTQTDSGFTANTESLYDMLNAMSENAIMTDELQSIFLDLISGMTISEGRINQLISIFPALTKVVRQNAEGYYVEIQALADSAKAGEQWAISMINSQNGVTSATSEQIAQRIKKYQTELQALLADAEADPFLGAYHEKQIANLKDKIYQLNNLLDSASTYRPSDFSSSGGVSVGGGGSSSGSTEEDPIAKQTDLFKEQIDILEHKLFLMEKEGATEEQRIAQLRQIQATLENQKQWYYSQGLDANSEYIRDLEEQWWDYEDQIKEIYQEQADIYESLFSAVADKAQEEIDKLEKEKDLIKEQNEALEDQISYEEKLDALARTKQQMTWVYKDGRFQYVQDQEAVSEAQKEIDELEREKDLEEQIGKIDKQIANWEAFRDAWGTFVDNYKKQQDILLLEQKFGIKLEGERWQERLGNLQDYILQYNYLISQINSGSISSNYQGTLSFVPDNRYASGSQSTRTGISLVGERGPELRILNEGDGILPTDVTKNLWSWGAITPTQMMNKLYGAAQSARQVISITIDKFAPNLPGVSNGEDFAEYMKNNFWRDTLQFVK